MLKILPDWLAEKITTNYVFDYVYEIRVRLNKPISINYKGKYQNICERDGYRVYPVIANADLIRHIVNMSTKQSMYAYNNQIKNCYISAGFGVRIGVCGTAVYNGNDISTIKNITSLNIRIPHDVKNCSNKIIDLICDTKVKNTLIISPPGAGKTTMIRDIVSKLSNEKNITNILVVDEREEISFGQDGISFTLGDYVDVVLSSKKSFAFNECLKTMNPSVIVTDEISGEEDIVSIKQAIKSGVSVIATAHALGIYDLKGKLYFKEILEQKFFERIIVLSKRNGVGTIECVYDENLHGIYLPLIIWKYV